MSRNRVFSAAHPTVQEITDHLDGLNRLMHSAIVSRDTPRLKAIAIANYEQWFKYYGIAIVQDQKSLEWSLLPEPPPVQEEPQPKR